MLFQFHGIKHECTQISNTISPTGNQKASYFVAKIPFEVMKTLQGKYLDIPGSSFHVQTKSGMIQVLGLKKNMGKELFENNLTKE